MLREKAAYYYFTMARSCSESILLAANDQYQLNLTDAEVQLFAGFRTGMGCGSTCGCLAGAIGVLSRMYGSRQNLHELCARFVTAFEARLACGTVACATLAARYKTPETRCTAAVALSADVLEEFINTLEASA